MPRELGQCDYEPGSEGHDIVSSLICIMQLSEVYIAVHVLPFRMSKGLLKIMLQ